MDSTYSFQYSIEKHLSTFLLWVKLIHWPTYLLHGAGSLLESYITQDVKKLIPCLQEMEGFLLCSEKSDTGLYPEPVQSSS
jgi:hypothetical protein